MTGERTVGGAPPATARPSGWRSIAAAGALWPAGLFLALYLVPLGWRPLLLPDEYRYAEIPREMLVSGDWVVPRLDGFVYFEKPALGYWLIAGSEALLGRNRFAVRLPSALATGLTALLVFWLVRRAGGARERAAPLAALVWLSSLFTVGVGTTAILDPPLTLFLTAALAAFFVATEAPPRSRRERGWLALSGVSCGLAFLTKGFLAFAVPALVAACYLLRQRRWRDLVRMPWLPAAAALLVGAPWSAVIHLREPDYWRFFFWHEHVQRFLAPSFRDQHAEPWWLLLAATPALLLPWTVLVPAAARGLGERRSAASRRLIRFCVTWAAVIYLFFSASSGKLVTYVLPAFPALAILMALGLTPAAGDRPARALRAGAIVGAAAFGLAAVGFGAYLLARQPALFTPPSRGVALAAALAAAAVLLVLAARATAAGPSLVLTALSLAPFLLVAQLALPTRVLASKAPGPMLARHRAEVGPHTLVLSDIGGLRAACWAFERSDVLLVGSPGELAYGVARDPERRRHLGLAEARRLIEDHRGRVVLVAEAANFRGWRPLLPAPASVEGDGYVFVSY